MAEIYDFETERRRRSKRQTTQKTGGKVVHRGQVQITGRDVNYAGRDININKREIRRTPFQPGTAHISAEHAFQLKQLVAKAVAVEVRAGKRRGVAYAKWWSIVQKHYKVNSYLRIPATSGEEAVSWLEQRVAMQRPRLRRRDPEEWRRQHYVAIYARAGEIGLSKREVHALAKSRLGLQLSSLKQLTQSELQRLYRVVMALPVSKEVH